MTCRTCVTQHQHTNTNQCLPHDLRNNFGFVRWICAKRTNKHSTYHKLFEFRWNGTFFSSMQNALLNVWSEHLVFSSFQTISFVMYFLSDFNLPLSLTCVDILSQIFSCSSLLLYSGNVLSYRLRSFWIIFTNCILKSWSSRILFIPPDQNALPFW